MRKFFIFFIIFGLWSSWENSKYKLFLRIYSIFSIALVFIFFSLAFLYNEFYEFNTLSYTISNLMFVLIFSTYLVIILESVLRFESQTEIVEKLSSVDNMFYTKLRTQVLYRKEKWEIFIRIFILVSTEIVIKISILVAVFRLGYYLNFLYFTLYANLVICLRLIEVSFFMYLLQARLKLVNRELIAIQHSVEPEISISENTFEQPSIYNRLLNLKQIYARLFGICEHIGSTFGWSLLMIVVHVFAISTFEFYWAYINIGTNIIMVAICLAFVVPSSVALFTLAFYGSRCSQQVWNVSQNLSPMIKFVIFLVSSR